MNGSFDMRQQNRFLVKQVLAYPARYPLTIDFMANDDYIFWAGYQIDSIAKNYSRQPDSYIFLIWCNSIAGSGSYLMYWDKVVRYHEDTPIYCR
jgi:hypothetical protein